MNDIEKAEQLAKQAQRKPIAYGPQAKRKVMDVLAVYRQFKLLAAEQDLNTSEALSEALNLLFGKYGKEPIA